MTTIEEYRDMLIEVLGATLTATSHLHIQDLEDYVNAAGLTLPIVRLPEHYLRGVKWFSDRGNVELCNCGALWPEPKEDPYEYIMNYGNFLRR